MAYEDYTVLQFMNCRYKNDHSETGIPLEIFKIVYDEYIDTSGLYDKEEFDKVMTIQYLAGRINTIRIGIRLQYDFLTEFDEPCEHYFFQFKKYGHTLFWTGDHDKFIDQLEKIQNREVKYEDQLTNKIKELKDLREKKIKKEVTIKQSRMQFIRMLNSLRKDNYKIDDDKTSVESLSLMIAAQLELIDEMDSKKTNTKR